jgi:hypothetical protein
LCVLAACGKSGSTSGLGTGTGAGEPAAAAAPTAAVTSTPPATPTVPAAADPSPPPGAVPPPVVDAAPAPPPRAGADFTAEARRLYQLVACQDRAPLADEAMAKVADRHCGWVTEKLAAYRERYIDGGRAFFDEIEPDDLPATVVYPFGGGDLISSLAAFPDADETTTISLELAGDPRRITTLSARQLDSSLSQLRAELGGTLSVGSNTSVNLSSSQQNDLPAQVSSFLLGMAAAGFEPVGMRYIQLQDDGSIHYVTAEEIAAADGTVAATRGGEKGKGARARKGDWTDPNFSEAFAHVEIEYRKAGDPTDRVRVHRHFGWNLHDTEMDAAPQLLRHLEQKGKVTVLVKGASYLLWRGDFSRIRDYLLGHLGWMLSDSTGIPPMYATRAGMVQDTYGRFSGAFLEGAEAKGKRHSDDFRALWAKNKKRRLPFRFGYVDAGKNAHLVVTRPAP